MRSYNLMVTRLSEMIERVYEAELTTQKEALSVIKLNSRHSSCRLIRTIYITH